mmetsp:Transcript_7848/g.15711  ORF Transcript_7848/g.15711 Transcript_7848/m.15711 type:complete len:270 (-) Transcript_7848:813-1622(-)
MCSDGCTFGGVAAGTGRYADPWWEAAHSSRSHLDSAHLVVGPARAAGPADERAEEQCHERCERKAHVQHSGGHRGGCGGERREARLGSQHCSVGSWAAQLGLDSRSLPWLIDLDRSVLLLVLLLAALVLGCVSHAHERPCALSLPPRCVLGQQLGGHRIRFVVVRALDDVEAPTVQIALVVDPSVEHALALGVAVHFVELLVAAALQAIRVLLGVGQAGVDVEDRDLDGAAHRIIVIRLLERAAIPRLDERVLERQARRRRRRRRRIGA